MRKLLISFLLSAIFFLFSIVEVSAQVVINEFYPGIGVEYSDWVEVYAIEETDLSLYRLEDKAGNKKDLEGVLAVGSFKSFDWSNKLDNDGDVIELKRISDDFELPSTVSYGDEGGTCAVVATTQSIGRDIDGAGNFVRFASQTRDASNNTAPQETCPSPSPSPSPAPSPSPTTTAAPASISTPTPAPAPAPTKTATPKPTVKASATESPQGEGGGSDNGQILGLREGLAPSPSPPSENSSPKSFPLAAVAFITGGLSLIGFSTFLFIKNHQKGYNEVGGQERTPFVQ